MLYRLVQLSGKYYATEIIDLASDQDEIEAYTEQGEIVFLCDDLGTFADLMEIEEDEIVIP